MRLLKDFIQSAKRRLREEVFEAILPNKRQELIVTYVTIGVSSGRESEEGEIVLRFKALR